MPNHAQQQALTSEDILSNYCQHMGVPESDFFEDMFQTVLMLQKDLLYIPLSHESGELSKHHMGILGALSKYKQLSVTELASMMRVLKPQMTVLLDKMEASDLIQRNPAIEDRRSILISLKPAGERALGEAMVQMRQIMSKKLAALNMEEIAELHNSLRTIVGLLRRI